MSVFSLILAGRGDKLSLLTKNGTLPRGSIAEIRIITGIKLIGKTCSLGSSNLYYLNTPIATKNGWKWVPVKSLKKLEQNLGQDLCLALSKFWDLIPSKTEHLKKIPLPSLFERGKYLNEAIFFPGSFNPWHRGHSECLNLCPNKSKIIVLPDNNPWKPLSQKQCKWKKYREICLLLKKSSYSVYPGFLAKNRKNPTINWLPKTNTRKKNLLMGDDSFMTLTKWKNAKKLIQFIYLIYVVPRKASPDQLNQKILELKKINPKLKVRILQTHRYQKISSTNIRKKLAIFNLVSDKGTIKV